MSISLIRYFTLALVLVTSLPVTAESTTTSTSQAQDVTQESPRERDRILLKRNPIASEYQEQGRLGLAPGASADSEGVDFRSKFRMKPLGGKPVTRIEPTISYQGTGDQIEPGGRIMLGRQIGGIGAQLQLSTTAATRVISHYQSRWVESLLEGESLSLLGFPRFSQDTYETRNSSVGIRLDAGSDRLQYFYELFASHYTDDAYRNRLEYQVATGFSGSCRWGE